MSKAHTFNSRTIAIIVFLCCIVAALKAQVNNVGIGTTTPDPSAVLELQATDQGFLVPRLDQSQENQLASPANGLLIYNTGVDNTQFAGFRYYDSSPAAMTWNTLLSQRANGELIFRNPTKNTIDFAAAGQSQPNTDLGWKLRTYGLFTYDNEDYGLGVDVNEQWYNVGTDAFHSFRVNGNTIAKFRASDDAADFGQNLVFEDNSIAVQNLGGATENLVLNPDGTTTYSTLSGTDLYATNTYATNAHASTSYATFFRGNNINTTAGQTTIGNANNDINLHAYRVIYNDPTINEGIWLQGNTILAITGVNSTTQLKLRDDVNVGGDLDVDDHLHARKMFITDTPGTYDGPGANDLTWNPADGSISREGSSLRYKENVKKAEVDFDKILDLEVKHYNMREGMGVKGEWVMGVIAEEADALGLKDIVVYSEIDGQVVPDGIKYKKIGLFLLEIAKKQKQTIENHEQEISNLKATNEQLANQMNELVSRLERLETASK